MGTGTCRATSRQTQVTQAQGLSFISSAYSVALNPTHCFWNSKSHRLKALSSGQLPPPVEATARRKDSTATTRAAVGNPGGRQRPAARGDIAAGGAGAGG